jgi:uroporphyrinogen decarboxylase
MGEHGVVGLCMLLPTLLMHWREPTEASFFDYYDHRDLLLDFIERWSDHLVQIAHAIVDQQVNPDFVFFPNSGLITMQSEKIMRQLSLPTLKKLTAIFKAAGITTSLHSCGKERAIVQAAAEETDLDCIDPLEIPPMGDCDLAEIKAKYGQRLALKGNLHTTQVMLGNVTDVRREALKAILAAGQNGGFVLSTGDQCGRDTPEENIRELVQVTKEFGVYPLDTGRIEAEIKRLSEPPA